MTTKSCATYEDVNLVLRLYDMRREAKMREARGWFGGNFKIKTLEQWTQLCPVGTDANAHFRQVTTYWEMVASFITNGVLHDGLFFESGRELLFVWERLRDLLPALREFYKDPRYLKNLEQVAEIYIKWMQAESPGSYEAFSKRVRA